MNQWTNGAVIQWINEPKKRWFNEPWNSESMNPGVNESMNERIMNGWKGGWMKGWMHGWMDGWALLLCWTSSSLSDLFAEVPLLSAILLLCTSALTCFPATSSVASAAQSSLHLFAHPVQCILQAPLQLRIVQTRHMAEKLPFAQLLQCALQPPATASHSSSVRTSMPCCAQPCQCDLSQRISNPRSRSAAPNRPTLAQRWQSARFRTAPNMADFYDLLLLFVKSTSSRYSLMDILPTWFAKSAPNMPFFFNMKMKSVAAVWCTFSRPHLPKFNILQCKWRSCAVLVGNFPRSTR